MTKIGVLSDTHLPDSPEATEFLQRLAEEHFKGVEMIIHAGDVVAPEILELFIGCPVHAVRGNMDPAYPGIPDKKIVGVNGFRIGIMHGWGAPNGIERRLLNEFSRDRVDCIVFGHIHRTVCRKQNDVLMFNPGSATDRRSMPYHTVGLLEVDDEIRGHIIRID